MTHTRPRIQVDDYATGIRTIYVDWNEFRAERRAASVELIVQSPAPCRMCLGNRVILHSAPNGEGLIPRPCLWCHGSGIHLNRGHGTR